MQTAIFVSAVIVLMFVAGSSYAIQAAYAEEIPSFVKNKISSWVSNKGDGDFSGAMVDLSNLGILKAKIAPRQNIYSLPTYGQTTFIKISGKTGLQGQAKFVFLTITDSKGAESEYTAPMLEGGSYSTVVPLTHSSPKGTYTITAHYEGKKIPDSFFYVEYPGAKIPVWVSNVAGWWLDKKITDDDFLAAMSFLINRNAVKFGVDDAVQEPSFDVSVNGQKTVRRGTAQNILVHVADLAGPVNGATVSVRVEDYGENVFEEFKGFTDSEGSYNVSWEISEGFPNLKTLLVYVDVTDGLSSTTKVFTFEVYCLCGEPNCKCRT